MMKSDHEDQIRRRAYEIWQSEGQPHGRDEEHWQKARVEVERQVPASGTGAAQAASRQGSYWDPARDSVLPEPTGKAATARSGAPGATSTRTKKPSGKASVAVAPGQRSGAFATAGDERQDTMSSELGDRRGEHSDPPPAPKYRHPEKPDLTWSGRGRRPAWVRDAMEAGRAFSDFEIGA
jgi:hypothetical protein